ncbi:hypothetical protein BD410DRAFT_845671 [Rickenella mellea]|uniref:DDE-1 domain-containing protein n=1 Tax=Rickenella mellea TaxID=50990 RepID=A0A4Y7PHY0_9AGAM|nr:hypothetical protein BD410DRAFT_845671 [Rickenella mellea]
MDQTQVVYHLGGGKTFEVQGAKQVAVVGEEEKCAFTLVAAVSGAGDLLPFQAIYKGKTKRSVPSDIAPRRDEAEQLGFRLSFSNTDTYWSTFELMQEWVCDILVPYWMRKKEELFVNPSQECLLQIDVWSVVELELLLRPDLVHNIPPSRRTRSRTYYETSHLFTVHKSKEFRDWMAENWTWIILEFVPGGTTSLFQPCDIGIQRPLKLSIKRSQNADIVQETLAQLEQGKPATQVRLDTTVGTLRDRTMNWLVTAYHHVNKPDIVKKAFAGCKSGEFNLSFESITSPDALQTLRDIQKNEPLVWEKIHLRADSIIQADGEDEPAFNDCPDDDSAVTIDHLVELRNGKKFLNAHVAQEDDGHLRSSGAAEDPFDNDAYLDGPADNEEDGSELDAEEVEELGRGKRRRVGTKKYNEFWRHD